MPSYSAQELHQARLKLQSQKLNYKQHTAETAQLLMGYGDVLIIVKFEIGGLINDQKKAAKDAGEKFDLKGFLENDCQGRLSVTDARNSLTIYENWDDIKKRFGENPNVSVSKALEYLVKLRRAKKERVEALYTLHRQKWFQNQLAQKQKEADDKRDDNAVKKSLDKEKEQELIDEQHLTLKEADDCIVKMTDKLKKIKELSKNDTVKLLAMEAIEDGQQSQKKMVQVETSLEPPSLGVTNKTTRESTPNLPNVNEPQFVDENKDDTGNENDDENEDSNDSESGIIGVTKAAFRKVFGQQPEKRKPNSGGRSLCKQDECEFPFDKWMGYQIKEGKCPRCRGVYSE